MCCACHRVVIEGNMFEPCCDNKLDEVEGDGHVSEIERTAFVQKTCPFPNKYSVLHKRNQM